MSRRPIQTSNFSYTELNPYLLLANDLSSMVDSYVELNQSDSIHFHDVQLCTMLINEN